MVPLRNSSAGYGLVAIGLHWLIALLFLGQIALGLAMVRLSDRALAFDLIQWHKSFGLLTLALVVLRLGWRLANVRPRLPASLPPWERRAARIGHAALYALMFLVPLTGWALVSTSTLAIPTFAFYLVIVPHLPLGVSDAAEAFWTAAHHFLAFAAIGLIGVHVLAAIRHHAVLHDDVLKKMLRPPPLRDARRE